MAPERTSPNIIITGTPGVGKTTHAELVAERTGLKHISVNDIVKDKECHEGWDEEYQSWIVDEDKVCFVTFSRSLSPILLLPFLQDRGNIKNPRGGRVCIKLVCWYANFRADKENDHTTAPRRHGRTGPPGRLHNRLARVRSLPQELD